MPATSRSRAFSFLRSARARENAAIEEKNGRDGVYSEVKGIFTSIDAGKTPS
jgi:hypothetical protein